MAAIAALSSPSALVAAGGLNILGGELQPCSHNGMALTGFTRTGFCEDYDEDTGSHNICIDIPSSKGGNFCTVTGQPDWCSEPAECHEDKDKFGCKVEHWCVCEWAFQGYLDYAGGCDQIADIVCESTNKKVIMHYKKKIHEENDEASKVALMCLAERCGELID